jgi:hypothetical protein
LTTQYGKYNGNIIKNKTNTRQIQGKSQDKTMIANTEQKHLALPAHTFSNTILKAKIDIRGIHDEGSILTVVQQSERQQ